MIMLSNYYELFKIQGTCKITIVWLALLSCLLKSKTYLHLLSLAKFLPVRFFQMIPHVTSISSKSEITITKLTEYCLLIRFNYFSFPTWNKKSCIWPLNAIFQIINGHVWWFAIVHMCSRHLLTLRCCNAGHHNRDYLKKSWFIAKPI